jgi:hypothetical protein
MKKWIEGKNRPMRENESIRTPRDLGASFKRAFTDFRRIQSDGYRRREGKGFEHDSGSLLSYCIFKKSYESL